METITAPEIPAAPPVADDPQPPAAPPADAPARPAWEPTGRLAAPASTNGVYCVIWARKPSRKADRPTYQEAAFVAASSPQRAKALVIEADDELGAFLRARAGEGKGILVRAVPAMHWPAEVEPTTFERPAPILTIR